MTLPKSAQRPHAPRTCIVCRLPFNPRNAKHLYCITPACQQEKYRSARIRSEAKRAARR